MSMDRDLEELAMAITRLNKVMDRVNDRLERVIKQEREIGEIRKSWRKP